MDNEQIEKLFDKFFFRMCLIDKRTESLEIQFRIAFCEGVTEGQKYVIERWEKSKKNEIPH